MIGTIFHKLKELGFSSVNGQFPSNILTHDVVFSASRIWSQTDPKDYLLVSNYDEIDRRALNDVIWNLESHDNVDMMVSTLREEIFEATWSVRSH